MAQKKLFSEDDLAAIAKKYRQEAKKTRNAAGRDLNVSHVSIFRAEEDAQESLLRLRIRIIEEYSPFKVVGPVFYLEKK